MLQASGDTKEKDRLFKKNAELMEEIENLKEQLELLRIERNCCQSRLNDLKKIKYEYEDLKEKTRRFDTLQAECACYKSKCENLCNIEAECQKFRKIAEKSEILETEKENLLKRLEDCMCIIHGHKDKIEDLLETTRSLDRLKAECKCYKNKCENLYNIETECEKLRKRAQKSEILEAERQDLLHKLQDCLTIINNHENKIKTLSDHIEALTQSLELKSQVRDFYFLKLGTCYLIELSYEQEAALYSTAKFCQLKNHPPTLFCTSIPCLLPEISSLVCQ